MVMHDTGEAEYEFGPEENATIDGTATASTVWGVVSLVVGTLVVGFGVYVTVTFGTVGLIAGGMLFASGVVQLVTAKFYLDAGRSFRHVVTTEGDDVAHMMQAMRKLTGAVQVEAIASMAAFFLAIVLVFMAFSSIR